MAQEGFSRITSVDLVQSFRLLIELCQDSCHIGSVWFDLDDRIRPIEHSTKGLTVRGLPDHHGPGRRSLIVSIAHLDLPLRFVEDIHLAWRDHKVSAALCYTRI